MTNYGATDVLSLARYREYLRSLAATRLDGRLQAQFDPSDIAQEAILKACRARDQFRGQSEQELIAWLRTILNNTLANALRSCARQKRDASVGLSDLLESASGHRNASPGNGQLSPDEIAVKNEKLLRLAGALARLPGDQRGVVEMRYLQGLSVAEICKCTGRSKPSVVGLLYRGVKAMRILIDELDQPTGQRRPAAI